VADPGTRPAGLGGAGGLDAGLMDGAALAGGRVQPAPRA
jgi:hypothetical protein